ncbi:MAG: DUF2306 domain-containing protein [Phenylobacterium sp.]|nr:MAG: DUF2306 domain-containing protein [Phenylobacterium sp.]
MSQQALSTAAYGPLLRRSLARASAWAFPIAAVIVALTAGPALVRGAPAIARSLAAHPPHAPDWGPIIHASPAIQIHLATILAAMVATAVLMVGVKGSRLHRVLGWSWTVAMLVTAVATLFIRGNVGPSFHGFGFLHLFAVVTLVSVPRAVLAARRHDIARHAAIVSALAVGGFGIAGVAAFLPGRLLWAVFWS